MIHFGSCLIRVRQRQIGTGLARPLERACRIHRFISLPNTRKRGRYPIHPCLLRLKRADRIRSLFKWVGVCRKDWVYFSMKIYPTNRVSFVREPLWLFYRANRQIFPKWADALYLGWLLRCIHRPNIFIPRYLKGISLGLFTGEVWKEPAADPWLSQVNKSVILFGFMQTATHQSQSKTTASKRASVHTLGCRLNQSEGFAWRESYEGWIRFGALWRTRRSGGN